MGRKLEKIFLAFVILKTLGKFRTWDGILKTTGLSPPTTDD